MRSPSPVRSRMYQDDRPSSSTSRPPLPVRSPSPTTSNNSSNTGQYSRRPVWEGDLPQPGALPSRPNFSPDARRYDRRGDRDRPGDRDPSGATRPFHERERDNPGRQRDRDRDRERDGPGPSGGRDTWLAPGAAGKGRAADDGWGSRRRGGQDRNRDRGPRDQREPRGQQGGRPAYDRDGPPPRNADYPDRGPARQPPPHLAEDSPADMDGPPPNGGWSRRPPNGSRGGNDSGRSHPYSSNPPRARNPSGTSQPYPPRGGAGPSNYSRPPPPSSMVDPSLWRTSYNPPPPSDRYPSLEYDEPPRPAGSQALPDSSDGRVPSRVDPLDAVHPPATAYPTENRDEEPEEGEELEEGELQSEDGELRDPGLGDEPAAVKVEPDVGLDQASPPLPLRSPSTEPLTKMETPLDPLDARARSPETPPSPSQSIASNTRGPPAPPVAAPSPTQPEERRSPPSRLPASPPPRETLVPQAEPSLLSEQSPPPQSPPPRPQSSASPAPTGPSLSVGPEEPSPSARTVTPPTFTLVPGTERSQSSPPPVTQPSVTVPDVAVVDSQPANSVLDGSPVIPVREVEMSSPVAPTVARQATPPVAMAIDEPVSFEREQPAGSADVSMEDVPPPVEVERKVAESAAAEDEADEDPVVAPAEEIFPLTEEEIADVVVVRAQARVSNDPYTAFLREQNIASLYHFNEQLSDEPSSRVPANPPSSPDSDADELPFPLSPLPNEARLAVAVRVHCLMDEDADKIDRLRNEYRVINAEWQATCQRLDRLTEKRNAAKLQRNGTAGYGFGYGNGASARTPNLSTPSGGPPTLGLGGVNANGAAGGVSGGLGSSVQTPSGQGPSMLLYEESSRSSRASRSRASNQDANNGYFADAVRSEAEFQSILASLEDADARDPNLRAARTTAVVPDMILRKLDRDTDTYDDESGLVTDPVDFYEDSVVLHGWTDDEKAVFEKRFARDPKQFGKISEYLPHKSTQDCVLYYYRTKKTVDFRSIVAQRGGSRRKGGRRGATKNSALLSNLVRKRPKADDILANATGTLHSGSATPRYDDDDVSAPATPSASGGGKKRSRTEGGATEDASQAAFGAQAKKSRMFELSADGGANPGRMASALLNGSARTSDGRADDTDEMLLALSSNGHVVAPDPSSARLAAIEAGEMTPAPKKKASRKKKPALPSATAEGALALEAMGAFDGPALEPGRKDSVDSHTSGSLGPDGAQKRKRSNMSSYWSAAEKAAFMAGLGQHGKDWALVSQSMQGVKTAVQVKNFFQTNADALGLRAIAEAASGDPSLASSQPHLSQTGSGLFEPNAETLILPPASSLAPPSFGQASRPFASSASPSLSTGSAEPSRPRSGMNIHDLLNSPDKPPALSSSDAAALAALRPPARQALNEHTPDASDNYGSTSRGPNEPHPHSRWPSLGSHGYASSSHDARPPPPTFAYDPDPRPSYSLPPPPYHYPPPQQHHDSRPYSSYAAPASHPSSSASRHPYSDYSAHSLPLPSRPYSASGPAPPAWAQSYPRSPSGEHPPASSSYGYHPQHHPQYPRSYSAGGGGEGEHQYPYSSRPQPGQGQGGSPGQEYGRQGAYTNERSGGAGPPAWAGQPPGWRSEERGGENRRVS